tara:strand:- start:1357 stop:2544 length:1188 start_codon:yes stop_codon:yes gene_type:complete
MFLKSSFSPIPSLRILVKSLISTFFLKELNKKELANPWLKSKNKFIWLSRSTYSLALIAEFRRVKFGKEYINIFIPDYFCNSALTLLRNKNIRLHFYSINSNLEPDKKSVLAIKSKFNPDIIIQVHYFGKEADTQYLFNLSKECNAWFIEDATHILLPYGSIGERGDFTMYSLYKHFPLPDGALLVFKSKFSIVNLKKSGQYLFDYINQPRHDLIIENRYIFTFKWLIKKFLQTTFNLNKSYFNERPNTEKIPLILSGPKINNLSLAILKYSISDIEKIVDYKKSIKKVLARSLNFLGNKSIKNEIQTIPYFLTFNPGLSPLELIKLLINQKKIWIELPFLFWPDLPPEVLNNTSSHFQANYLLNTTVFLPLHQSTKIRSLRKFIKNSNIYRNQV